MPTNGKAVEECDATISSQGGAAEVQKNKNYFSGTSYKKTRFFIVKFKSLVMKNVFMLLGALVLGSVIIQQLLAGKTRKHIRSRKDDPSIPPISVKAF